MKMKKRLLFSKRIVLKERQVGFNNQNDNNLQNKFQSYILYLLKMISEDLDLIRFFEGLGISTSSIDVYIQSLSEIGVSDMADLRSKASVFSLNSIGLVSADVDSIMQKLFTAPLPPRAFPADEENPPSTHDDNDHTEEFYHRPIQSRSAQRLRRDEMIVIKEIGHGASGRVFKALFCPTLTFLAVKVYQFHAHHYKEIVIVYRYIFMIIR
jgi:hypothetical protein